MTFAQNNPATPQPPPFTVDAATNQKGKLLTITRSPMETALDNLFAAAKNSSAAIPAQVKKRVDLQQLRRQLNTLGGEKTQDQKRIIFDALSGKTPTVQDRQKIRKLIKQHKVSKNISLLVFPPLGPNPLRFAYGACGVSILLGLGIIVYGALELNQERNRPDKSFVMGFVMVILGSGITAAAMYGYHYYRKKGKNQMDQQRLAQQKKQQSTFATQAGGGATDLHTEKCLTDLYEVEPPQTVVLKFIFAIVCILLSIHAFQVSYANMTSPTYVRETVPQRMMNLGAMLIGMMVLVLGFNFLPYDMRNLDLISMPLPNQSPPTDPPTATAVATVIAAAPSAPPKQA